MVGLSDCGKVKKFLVHRLVASAFVPGEIKGLQVNHINGVRNDNRSDNLEWVTASENLKHSYKNLGRKAQSNRGRCTGKENHWSKPVISTGEDGSERRFESGMQAAKELGLKKSSISSCCQGKANQTGGYKFRFA